MLTLQDLMVPVQTLAPDDSLTAALHACKTNAYPLPVVREGVLVGMLWEEALVHAELPFDQVPVSELMSPAFPLTLDAPLEAAWESVRQHRISHLPVVDGRGRFLGLVTRADLLAARMGELRPARIGGMATLGGVLLTTGHLRAGAGDLFLVLTGMLFAFVGWALLCTLLLLARSVPLGGWEEFLLIVAFLLVLRFSPLAGHHAAEHQTVHAIERGEPLTLASVRQQPREHPRCGTNFMAILLGMGLLMPWVKVPLIFGPGALLLLFTWHRIGMWLQRHFTTKPATEAQLLAAIETGKQLLKRYQVSPTYRAPGMARIWMMGIIQITLGAVFMEALIRLCGKML